MNWTNKDLEDVKNIIQILPGAVFASRSGVGTLMISVITAIPDDRFYDYARCTEKSMPPCITNKIDTVEVNPLLIPSLGCGVCVALKEIGI